MKQFLRLAALAATLAWPAVASANLVIDGDFASPSLSGSYQTYNANSSMGAWKVTAGSVDLIHNYWSPPAGAPQSVDMAGLQAGTIQQAIITSPGYYRLTFDMAGNPDGSQGIKTLQVTFGDTSHTFTFDDRGKTRSNMGWTLETWDFHTSSTSTLLIFKDVSIPSTAYGSAIAEISLASVPEPTTIISGMMLLLPFGAGAMRKLRGSRAA